MKEQQDISVLDVDGTPYAVESLSEEIQNMVRIFNTWNKEEAEIREEDSLLQNNIMQIVLAKENLSQRIMMAVRERLTPEKSGTVADD